MFLKYYFALHWEVAYNAIQESDKVCYIYYMKELSMKDPKII